MTVLVKRYHVSSGDWHTHASDAFTRVGLASRTEPAKPDLRVVLTGKIAPGWKIVKPIALDIKRDEGFFIISDDIFLVYGYGESLEAARADYIQSLLEYYDILFDKTDGPTRSLFRHLKSYLRPIPA